MLKNFKNNPKIAVLDFFSNLKYPVSSSERFFEDYQEFERFARNKQDYSLNPKKILKDNFIKLEYAFSLNENFIPQNNLFGNEDDKILKNYLFVVLHLENRPKPYTRTELADAVRELNRVYSAGVFVVFSHNDLATFGIIDRRKNKKDDAKNVLQKVTLIKDINVENMHRGHHEILKELDWDNLNKKLKIKNIDHLHEAWAMVLDIKLLNDNFFKDIRNWYFWASKSVNFPQINPKIKKDNLIHQQESVIRLLTRLLFCWFLKEKGFIPDEIFEVANIKNTLKDFEENHLENGDYYKAVLQNLFFATLNVPTTERNYYVETKKYDKNAHLNQNIYRYYETYQNADNIKSFFGKIPFLNGGLFECLDKKDSETKEEIRLDGFSVRAEKQAKVPNILFFAKNHKIDLSEEFGNKKMNDVPMNGLINILNKYKFTVEENTPLDQDVALDPEMLGQIFESLLAYFNPETAQIARKSTGSFYTPKEIVQYMTEESLNAFLVNAFKNHNDFQNLDLQEAFRNLLHEHTETSPFSENQNVLILEKIYTDLKIFDPACGSGAFPMGILDKLVKIVRKLDQNNNQFAKIVKKPFEKLIELENQKIQKLKNVQNDIKQFLEDEKAKNEAINALNKQIAEIERNFEINHNLKTNDYARKLYLIQNCIYGVDIQQIAVQISKLRFFIALIIEQTKNDNENDNFGVETLPNLETKIVCANTLIRLEATKSDLFNDVLLEKEKKLQENRNQYFNAQSQNQKNEIKKLDATLRKEIADLLQNNNNISKENAQKLIDFDIFSQNAQASWFDMQRMFGIDKGFDIVIGNPPYVNIENIDKKTKTILFEQYETCKGRTDLYIAFIEGMTKKMKENGVLSFIIPYAFTNQNYGSLLRKMLVDKYFVREIVDTSNYFVFDNAVVKNIILSISLNSANENTRIRTIKSANDFKNALFQDHFLDQNLFLKLKEYRFETKPFDNLLSIKKTIWEKSVPLEKICFIAYGARLNHKTQSIGKSAYIHKEEKNGFKPFTEGECIERYKFSQYGWLDYKPKEHYNAMFKELFEYEKIMFINIVKDKLRFAYDNQGFYNSHTVVNCIKYDLLENVDFISVKRALKEFDANFSKNYNYKFLLAILNSTLINWYFVNFLSESLHFYPEDAKSLPIPQITPEAQKPFEILVEIILDKKAKGEDTTKEEAKIDEMVYALYGLTQAEISIIEG